MSHAVVVLAAALFLLPVTHAAGQAGSDPLRTLPVHRYQPGEPPAGGVVFFSGDGGWRSFDKTNADSLRSMGYWVLGVDCLHQFERELSRDSLVHLTRTLIAWLRLRLPAGAPVYLAGYSFGADVIADAAGAGLPGDGIILLGPGRRGIRKVTLSGFLFREPTGPTSYDNAERLNQRGCLPAAFITGEADKAGEGAYVYPRTRPPAAQFIVPGAGHHYHGGDARYVAVLRQALAWLDSARAGCAKR